MQKMSRSTTDVPGDPASSRPRQNPNVPTIDVVLPVHNEGGSIEKTLEEFHEVVAEKLGIPIRFIVCEDGSSDNTVEVLQKLAEKLPLLLISEPGRKGYSRAVIDGFKAATQPLICFVDSDGQYDPYDFEKLYSELHEADCDLVVGYRNPRQDSWVRILMSALFNQVYKLYFSVGLKDPSCPYLIIRRDALRRILTGNVGLLKQGFWWEFFARAKSNNLRMRQIPISHRTRVTGASQVYLPLKVPGIAFSHLRALSELHRELHNPGGKKA